MTRRSDYIRCYDGGRKFFSGNFVLFVREREDAALPWRFGMAVTKKTGTAVRRNRVRRLIRECFRLWQKELPGGCDFVVVPKRQADPAAMDLALVARELVPLFHRQSARKA